MELNYKYFSLGKIPPKAQIFSMIAIMMSLLFVLIFSSMTHVPLDRKVPITKEEVTQVDSFVKDFDRLVINAIDQSAYGSLSQFALLQQRMYNLSTDYFFENFSNSFKSCFEGTNYVYNSTLNNTPLVCDSSYVLGNSGYNFSFKHYLDNLFSMASGIYNVSISYENIHADIIPSNSPFYISVNVSLMVHLSRNDYSWDRYISVIRDVSINGISHPLIMNRRIFVYPSIDGDNFYLSHFDGNASLVAEFIDGSYYYRDNRSPSLIDLFNGNIPDNGGFNSTNVQPYGIGSFIPANATYLQGPAYRVNHGNTSSSIEYDYINKNAYNPDDLRRISSPEINVNQTFQKDYVEDMGFNLASNNVKLVSGQCDDSGCN